jgi:hypothetical protein
MYAEERKGKVCELAKPRRGLAHGPEKTLLFDPVEAARSLINTAGLARCKNVPSNRELFQQFIVRGEKLLKQLRSLAAELHRAKAAVLMRTGANRKYTAETVKKRPETSGTQLKLDANERHGIPTKIRSKTTDASVRLLNRCFAVPGRRFPDYTKNIGIFNRVLLAYRFFPWAALIANPGKRSRFAPIVGCEPYYRVITAREVRCWPYQ